MKIWIVYETTDYEGCAAPAGAYSSEAMAREVAASAEHPQMIVVEEFDLDAPPKPYRVLTRS